MTEPSLPVDTVINGAAVSRRVPTRMMLSDFLREEVGLTGTKVSCELQVCGVCSVLVDGQPVNVAPALDLADALRAEQNLGIFVRQQQRHIL